MKNILAAIVLLTLLIGCNTPAVQQAPALDLEQQAATVVAQTLSALTAEGRAPLASPIVEETVTPTLTPPPPSPIPATQTPSATLLTVDSNTNCREGPGQAYNIVIVLVPGTEYQMVARTADNKYWVVTEIGKAITCWVPADMSNAFGNISVLPVTTPSAPTSAASAAQAPTGLTYKYECTYNGVNSDIKVTLTWADRSNNETGFRVYRDGMLIAEVGANVTTYADLFAGSATVLYSYRVSAFNSSGEAPGNPISFSCQ